MALNNWSSGPAADSQSDLWSLQDRLPVRLIATPREQFSVCTPDERISDVVARNEDGFDYFPVVAPDPAGDGGIVGLLHIASFMADSRSAGLVKDELDPISESNLIGADASVLEFIQSADRQECRLVVSGRAISGLVCLAALQKLPVRAAFAPLFASTHPGCSRP